MTERDGYIGWFEELGAGDVARVGGKNASLGEMVRGLKSEGGRVPDGFATTAEASRKYRAGSATETTMRDRIEAMRSGCALLHETGEAIRRLFFDGEFPTQLILGVDRHAGDPTPLFDCGQAPSNDPVFAAFLVEPGTDSISLNPDSFGATVRRVAEVEQRWDAARQQCPPSRSALGIFEERCARGGVELEEVEEKRKLLAGQAGGQKGR